MIEQDTQCPPLDSAHVHRHVPVCVHHTGTHAHTHVYTVHRQLPKFYFFTYFKAEGKYSVISNKTQLMRSYKTFKNAYSSICLTLIIESVKQCWEVNMFVCGFQWGVWRENVKGHASAMLSSVENEYLEWKTADRLIPSPEEPVSRMPPLARWGWVAAWLGCSWKI